MRSNKEWGTTFKENLGIVVANVSQVREYMGYDTTMMTMLVLGDIPILHPEAGNKHIAAYLEAPSLARMEEWLRKSQLSDQVPLVCFVAEEYGIEIEADSNEEAEMIHADVGPLEEAFEAGNPAVAEQLGWYAIDPKTRKTAYVARRYRYIPSEGWQWDDPLLINASEAIPLEIELGLNQVVDVIQASR